MYNLSWTSLLLEKETLNVILCIILKFECSQYRKKKTKKKKAKKKCYGEV